MKKLIPLFLAILCLSLALWSAQAADSAGLSALKVNPYGGAETDMETVCWYSSGSGYFLFLPADTELEAARVYLTAEEPVTLDGSPLRSGDSAAALTPGSHALSCGGQSYALTVCRSETLPAVYIRTESGSLDYIHADKENKEPGLIRVYEDGVLTLDKDLKQIKGRGNSTWYYRKKPYNIKFDKKTALLGMDKAKKWTLLANYIDLSLLHNACAFELGAEFGQPYTSQYRWVDLYINGDYLGNYLVCESVEVGDNRVEIPDLEDANEDANPDLDIESLPRGGSGPDNSVQGAEVKGSRKWVEIPQEPAELSGGYLLEYEMRGRYDMECSGFVTPEGQPVVIKSPEYASRGEVNYIADLMDAASEALHSPTGYNAAGRHYSAYFDVDSLALTYILNELAMNYDAGFSSLFAYKSSGDDKIHFGPVWDMDNAFGSPYVLNGVSLLDTEIWFANQLGRHALPSVLATANRHAEFRALVREKWAALRSSGALDAVVARIEDSVPALRASAVMNGLRWNRYKTLSPQEAEAAWRKNVSVCTGFLKNRIAALDKGFAPDSAYLYFAVDGASEGQWATPCLICRVGESLSLCDVRQHGTLQPPEGLQFYCWSTEPNGGGQWYLPGERLTLTKEETVLYAVWQPERTTPFVDVLPEKYYFDAVYWAWTHAPRVVSGTDETHFSPRSLCTRAQVLTAIYSACGKPKHHQSQSPFLDVSPGKYYYDPVLWAVEQGITSGVGGGKFGVRQNCTREQVVFFLWRVSGSPEPSLGELPFTDVNPSKYYYKAVLWAVEAGVTSGVGGGKFGVGRACTRAQMVCFLYEALGHGE